MDLDGDGHKDIISGGYPGELYLFRGNGDGTFRSREELINRYSETINVGKSSVPFACDWDLDGDLDLLVGTIEGHVYLIPNASDDVYIKYGNAERLTVNGEPIEAGTEDAGPCVADWDGDGNHDLLLGGEDGRVLLFRNRSSDGMPELEAPIFLIPAGDMLIETGDEGSGSNIGGRTKLCVADWNGDGRDDLMAGVFAASRRDTIKSSSWEQVEYERLDQESKEIQQKQIIIRNEIRTRILKDLGVPVDERPPQEKMTEYMTRMGNELRKHTGYQELTGQITQVVRQRNRIKSQMSNPYEIHGWVWVFLRKDTAQQPEWRRR